MNTTIGKINALGRIGHIICLIGKIFTMIGAIACLAGALIMCFIPRNAVVIEFVSENSALVMIDGDINLSSFLEMDGTDLSIEWGDNTYKFVGADGEPITEKTTFHLADIKWILFTAVIVCAVAHIVFSFGDKLCVCFEKCDTPFTEEISKGLFRLAIALLSMSIMSSLVGSVAESVIGGKFDISISIDLSVVLTVLCIFMLSFIFKHGTKLQKEFDETL